MKTLLIILFNCFLLSRGFPGANREGIIKITGETQGTTYHITYLSQDSVIYKNEIDSIFKKIDSSLSTYLPVSIISRINKNDNSAVPDKYFRDVFKKAQEVSNNTDGYFDISVAPLVNVWGFGFTKKEAIDSAMIDRLRKKVGYKMVKLDHNHIVKEKQDIMLDFNAIAQGYTVDVIAAYLESRALSNYLVEVGGEVKAKGKKKNGDYWKVAIDQPTEDVRNDNPFKAIINLNNSALSSSGNYRKFYEINGRKYSHFIDPFSGYPVKNSLLSATVMATDCMTADAYSTAFMVMGLEKAKQFLIRHKKLQLEVFFIYDECGNWKTYATDKMKKRMIK